MVYSIRRVEQWLVVVVGATKACKIQCDIVSGAVCTPYGRRVYSRRGRFRLGVTIQSCLIFVCVRDFEFTINRFYIQSKYADVC